MTGEVASSQAAPPIELPDLVGTAVPFNRPKLQGEELRYMQLSVEHGHTSADGPFSAAVSDLLREETGAAEVLMTTSCTAALELSAMLLDVGPGDTVVVPSFGFVTTALAYTRQGASVLFCDIEEETLGLDPAHLAEIMDPTVKAVVPIHYAGVACDLDGIDKVLVDWPEASLVEDNAHGLFGRYRDRPLGGFGRFSTLSFHETKNFTCGEGGAIVVNHPDDVARARVVYHKGTNRSAFIHGLVDKYTWQDTGSSFGLSDVLAAYLYAQLEQRDRIMDRRRHVFDRYATLLAPEAEKLGASLPSVPSDRIQGFHMFYVLVASAEQRTEVLARMREDEVNATFHYLPLHRSPHGEQVAARPTRCPVTDDVSARLLRLPFYTDLSDDDCDRSAEALLAALEASG